MKTWIKILTLSVVVGLGLMSVPAAHAQTNYNFNVGGLSFSSASSVPGSCAKDGSFFWLNSGAEGWYSCINGVPAILGGGASAFSCVSPLACSVSSGTLTVNFITTGKTGQPLVAQNGGQPSFLSPAMILGNSGAVINSGGAYTALCDTSLILRDRGQILEFQTGANVAPVIPDSTATGCGGIAFVVNNENSAALTFGRSGADTFTVCPGTSDCTTAQTSFTLQPGQNGVVTQSSTTNWIIRLSPGPQPTFGTNAVIGGQITLNGSTSGSSVIAPNATSSSTLFSTPITMANNSGIIFTQSTSPAGTQGPTFNVGGTGTTELFTFTGGTSTGLIKSNAEQSFSFGVGAFTLAASPLTIATWTMPNVVKPWGWRCDGQWSNPAGTTPTLAFGLNFGTASPTIAEQSGTIYETNAADGAFSGKQAGTTTNGTAGTNANFITTGTITNSATLFQFHLTGTFTAAATTSALSVTASLTGTGATGTLAGHCYLY